jgi:prevent-host-death family protein
VDLIRIGANKLRNSLGTLIDRVERGQADVIITRYLRPIVVMIPYRDYLALKDQVDALRAARQADDDAQASSS